MQEYSPRVQKGWAFYDWANSVYSLVISTAIFPIYYASVVSDKVNIFGLELNNTSLYTYVLSASFFMVILLSPILSGIADYTGRKKTFLRRFCYIGSISCMALFFFEDESFLWLGLLGTFMASIGFWGSLVFYNSYLPEIAPVEKQDKLSARGFAIGYLGSSILLIASLVLIESGVLETGFATRIVFVITGIWWLGFAQITFARLPVSPARKSIQWSTLTDGFKKLRTVWDELKHAKNTKRFISAFFLYSVGVQTVILVSSLYGTKVLNLETSQLIITILLIQFVGIAGSVLFSFLSKKIGNIRALSLAVVVWVLVCVSAYLLNPNDPLVITKFYIVGGLVGLVLGGVQSLSRSTFSKMLPQEADHTTWFSFYDVTEKAAIVLGTFTFAFLEDVTDNMRYSILSLTVFFFIGFVVLRFVKMPKEVA